MGRVRAAREAQGELTSLNPVLVVSSQLSASEESGKPLIRIPLGLPPFDAPLANQPTVERVALGRRLFFEKSLSGNNSVSCVSCHKPEFGYADDRPLSPGATGKATIRHTPSLLNSAYQTSLFWDGRATVSKSRFEALSKVPRKWRTQLPLLSNVSMQTRRTGTNSPMPGDPGRLRSKGLRRALRRYLAEIRHSTAGGTGTIRML
jgi:cytochrome c peroxidase